MVDGKACTGILVTPRWVLTANHCITGKKDELACYGKAWGGPISSVDSNVSVNFNSNQLQGSAQDPQRIRVHTLQNSGLIQVRTASYVNLCSSDNAAEDIALIRLDRRLPTSLVPPLHPPTVSNVDCWNTVCNHDSFPAVLIGYGPASSGGQSGYRNFRASEGWDYDYVGGGEFVIKNDWFTGPYEGGLPGDSGGALLVDKDCNDLPVPRNLCGVFSMRWTFVSSKAYAADVHSQKNQEWLHSRIVDPNTGWFDGECPGAPQNTDVDGDNDDVPDCLDNCPPSRCPDPAECANPNQADGDGDGIGDQCDLCQAQPGPQAFPLQGQISPFGTLGNKNLENELAVHYPAATSVPPNTPIAQLRQRIVPDLCDPNGVARHVTVLKPDSVPLSGDKGALSKDLDPDVQAIIDDAGPVCKLNNNACEVTSTNRVLVDAFVGLPSVADTKGQFTFGHCQCPTPEGIAGRFNCREGNYHCRMPDGPFFIIGNWKFPKIRLPEKTWADAMGGIHIPATFGQAELFKSAEFYWDFWSLPYFAAGKHNTVSVKGIGWTQVVNWIPEGTQPTGASIPTTVNLRNFWSNASADVGLRITYAQWFIPMDIGPVVPCQTGCPEMFGNVVVRAGNPADATPAAGFTFDGAGWRLAETDPAVGPAVAALIPALAAGSERLVIASEPFQRDEPPGTSIRAITLDVGNRPVHILSGPQEGPFQASQFGCFACDVVGSSTVVLSSWLARYFVFGDGEPSVIERSLESSLPTTSYPIEAGFRPGKVLAGTWRNDDGSVYAVDEAPKTKNDGEGPSTWRLRRWRYGLGRFETLGVLPTKYTLPAPFARTWLQLGPAGELVFVASGGHSLGKKAENAANQSRSVVVVMRVTGRLGDIEPVGAKVLDEDILVRPIVGSRRIQYVVGSNGTFAYRVLRYDDLSKHLKEWLPHLVHGPAPGAKKVPGNQAN